MAWGLLDTIVLGLYLVVILAIGLWAGRRQRDTTDYFLGGRRQHWLIVGLSIVATEVSAATFILVPAEAFGADWTYLQMYAGAIVGKMLIVYFLLPAFYGSSVTTVYEYLGRRFGTSTRTTATILFFASRIVGSGIRLLAAAIAISALFDWSLPFVIIGVAGMAVAYTTFGGIKAIIWTDAVQAIVFLLGGAVAVGFLFYSIPGSWSENLTTAYDAGKLHTFTWDWNPNNQKAFWVLLIHATVMNMAALGTDQDLTQRMLTCPDLRRGQRSLIFNTFVGLPVVCLFLLVGTLLYVYYQSAAGAADTDAASQGQSIFPHFIATAFPSGYGLRGLLVAGIFAAAMSSLDSALGALSSTAVTDIYRVFIKPSADERHYLRVARLASLLFGVLLASVALAFIGYDELLWETFKWASLVFGGLLGIFLLGVTTKTRGRDITNVVAMISSVVLLGLLKWWQDETGTVIIAFPWWVVLGTAWTYVFGICFRPWPHQDARDPNSQPCGTK